MDPAIHPERRMSEGKGRVKKTIEPDTVCEKEIHVDVDKPNMVDHPPHYNNRSMEAIDIIEMIIKIENDPVVAYNMSNVVKYLLRFRDKGTPVQDLEKARWYLNRMIWNVERSEGLID